MIRGVIRRATSCSLIAILLSISLDGCATQNNAHPVAGNTPQDSKKQKSACDHTDEAVGTGVGVGLGILAGKLIGKSNAGMVIGGLVGGALGNLIGRSFDQRACEMDKIATQNGIQIEHEKLEYVPPPIPQPVTQGPAAPAASSASQKTDAQPLGETTRWPESAFPFGSAELTPQARNYFTQVAKLYLPQPVDSQKLQSLQGQDRNDYLKSLDLKNTAPILLIGNTDDVGSSLANQRLSEARARTVGEVFRAAGVSPARIFYWGAGETRPIVANDSDAGRAKNRRVDSVEFVDRQALMNFIAAAKPHTDFYRPAKSQPIPSNLQAAAPLAPPAPTATPPSREIPKTVDQAPEVVASAMAAPRKPPTRTGGKDAETSSTKNAKPSTSPVGSAVALVDFGGGKTPSPIGSLYDEAGGPKQNPSVFGFISEAHAASPPTASCADDRARYGGTVRSLANDKPVGDYKTNEFLPGLYNVPWGSIINDNLVVLNGMAVLRSNYAPAANPSILIYPAWNKVPNKGDAVPAFDLQTTVNVYDGQNGFVYRVFPTDPKVITCMDMLIPYTGMKATDGRIHYNVNDIEYVAGYTPAVLR